MLSKAELIAHQQGAALVVSLIMLVLMTLIGVTAMRVTTVQEKMVANSRDLNVAFQAAETALRRGEDYIKQAQFDPAQPNPFSNDCSLQPGLCRPTCSTIARYSSVIEIECAFANVTPPSPPQWELVNWAGNSTLEYGRENLLKGISAITPLPTGSVARQPRFIIEDITPIPGGMGLQVITIGLYRITAQGYGQAQDETGRPLARVTLQSIFKKRS